MRFEYLIKPAPGTIPQMAPIEETQNMLNELGNEEWELVAVHNIGANVWPTFILKRQIRPAGTR